MRKFFTFGLACIVLLILTSTPASSRSLSFSSRPQFNTQTAPGAYTIAMTTQFIEQEMIKNDGIGLSIALVNDNGIIWEKGFGWADKENQVPAGPESVYMIGSVSKFLTALATLRLHEQGIVDIDSPVATYLPQFKMKDRYGGTSDPISVRRLLNHHSGIPGDIWTAGFLMGPVWDQWGSTLYSDWLFDTLAETYQSLPPGTLGVYCNTGFVLAGEIALEMDGITGESYPEYMDRILFTPLGMTSSSYYTIYDNLALGHVAGQAIPPMQTNGSFGATGGAYSTVRDMARLMAMVINQGKDLDGQVYLKPETISLLDESEKSSLDINSYMQYGLGLDTVKDPDMAYAGRTWAKNGSTGTYNAFMEILPDMELGVIVLSNSDTAEYLVYEVARECLKNAVFESFGLPPLSPDLPVVPSTTDPLLITGIYAKGNGWDEITDNGDGTLNWLQNAHTDTPQSDTLVYDGTAYFAQNLTASISFSEVTHNGKAYDIMIQSGDSFPGPMEALFGERLVRIMGSKITKPAIPAAWQQRTGIYLIDNQPWNEFPEWTQPFAALTEKKGFLLWSANNEVLLPEDGSLAYVAGITSRAGSALRAVTHNGTEKLAIAGYRYLPIDQVPGVTPGQSVSGTVDIFDSDWYRYEADAGQTITVTIPDGSAYYLNLFDPSLFLLDITPQQIVWTATKTGTYYFRVSPTPDADKTYSMTLTVN